MNFKSWPVFPDGSSPPGAESGATVFYSSGKPTQIDYDSGKIRTFAYDENGLPDTIDLVTPEGTFRKSISYNPDGTVSSAGTILYSYYTQGTTGSGVQIVPGPEGAPGPDGPPGPAGPSMSIASQSQAESGTDNEAAMTALRVAQAVAARAAAKIDTYYAEKISGLATVATTGAWADVSGKPAFAIVATSGAYSSLSGTPSFASVATSGTLLSTAISDSTTTGRTLLTAANVDAAKSFLGVTGSSGITANEIIAALIFG